jgi:hypothetical protein
MGTDALLTRDVISEVACPSCQRPLVVQEMCVPTRSGVDGSWVIARRFCQDGCLLVGVQIPSPRYSGTAPG